jgi:hypothetical protein
MLLIKKRQSAAKNSNETSLPSVPERGLQPASTFIAVRRRKGNTLPASDSCAEAA